MRFAGLYHRVPMTYASWNWREPAAALAALVIPPSEAPSRLRQRIQQEYGAPVSLWSSGRAALEAAFRASRDAGCMRVLMPALLCRSVPERAVAAGLRPVFYDIGPDLRPDLDQALSCLGSEPACLLAPHLYGLVSSLRHAHEACRRAGALLIEDCAASFLLRREDGSGCAEDCDFAIFSFNTGKTLVAGSGGALLQRRPMDVPVPAPWSALQERLLAAGKISFGLAFAWPAAGYTFLGPWPWRLCRKRGERLVRAKAIPAVDARLVEIQWKRWEALHERRLEILRLYATQLSGVSGIRLPQYAPGRYLTRMFIEFPVNINNAGRPRYPVPEFLRARGIQTHLPYPPLHLDPAFGPPSPGRFPVAEHVADSCVAVPSQPELTDRQVRYVCEAVRQAAARIADGSLKPISRADIASAAPETAVE